MCSPLAVTVTSAVQVVFGPVLLAIAVSCSSAPPPETVKLYVACIVVLPAQMGARAEKVGTRFTTGVGSTITLVDALVVPLLQGAAAV